MSKDANPQTLFTGNKKMFQSSFGFRRLYIPDESKRNLQKGLTCTKSVYSTSRMVLFRSKRNFKFPFQKIEVFFPTAFVLFCCQKWSIWVERNAKQQMLLKEKRNRSKFWSWDKKLREKKQIYLWFLTRKWNFGFFSYNRHEIFLLQSSWKKIQYI